MSTNRRHNFVRILGEKQRSYRGWKRKDHIKLNEKELLGYVLVVRSNGVITETTHCKGRTVKGFQQVWLARQNGRILKVDNEPVIEEIFTQSQVLAKVANGELTVDQATQLLDAA